MKIRYKKGFKYQIISPYACMIDIKPLENINTDYIALTTTGCLIVKEGYAFDGPSGPTIDTRNFMRGSLIHDCCFQLLREGHLPQRCRKQADIELRKACREDGMSKIRAWWVYRAVRLFGKKYASTDNKKPILTAP